jgi:hypothetical protein
MVPNFMCVVYIVDAIVLMVVTQRINNYSRKASHDMRNVMCHESYPRLVTDGKEIAVLSRL